MLRYLSPRVYCFWGIFTPGIFTVSDSVLLSVSNYSCETYSTSNLSHAVALLKPEVINEYLLDDIEMLLKSGNKKDLDSYFRAARLYSEQGERVVALELVPDGLRVCKSGDY
ncbi:MAG: hypothetical protein K2H61_09580 [Muribaculaceae bacterium]|nr:hypothetical protein [Muribaculaceae bacterium]